MKKHNCKFLTVFNETLRVTYKIWSLDIIVQQYAQHKIYNNRTMYLLDHTLSFSQFSGAFVHYKERPALHPAERTPR